jgi:phage-related minor tail protein
MDKAQAVSELSRALAAVAAPDETSEIIRRALRVAGLSNASNVNERDVVSLLQALAAEGGAIEELAQQIARDGLDPEPRAA